MGIHGEGKLAMLGPEITEKTWMQRKGFVKGLLIIGAGLGVVYGVLNVVAKKKTEDGNIDNDNPYLHPEYDVSDKDKWYEKCHDMRKVTVYERKIKPALDKMFSFGGLVLLSPLVAGISFAVWIDDPGAVFFTQKRIGKDKHYMLIHKFRTMRSNAPHDVPTHQLTDPDQYITKVGRFLRKTSLDELPQLWDIFRGKMSIIGPRPALWNQGDLVREREKYGANSVMPGLTGWAQINGRDELSIPDKARMDGEYVEKQGLMMDIHCFLGTIVSVLRHEGIVEGDTGGMRKTLRSGVPEIDPAVVFGCDKDIKIDKHIKKKVLITGSGSYVGESFREYAAEHYPTLAIETLDMVDGSWRDSDFALYDTIYHVAGIAHTDVGNVSAKMKETYYTVNTDLAIEIARKAKAAGVNQFVFMSSMIIYGESAGLGQEKMITRDTKPFPINCYGDSKWQADKAVRNLETDDFKIAVIRSPMIYGPGSKGNYSTLSKIARKLPLFPDIANARSMLFIDNFCEFLCQLIISGENGVYFPQNGEYTKTSRMAEEIGIASKKPVRISKSLNMVVKIASCIPGKISGLIDKAFGSSCYDQALSRYSFPYQIYNLKESILATEVANTDRNNKKVLIVASVASMIDQFNIPNIKLLISMGFDVDVAANFSNGNTCTDEKIRELLNLLDELDVDCYHIEFERNIKDIRANLKVFKQLDNVVKGKAKPQNHFRHHHIEVQDGYSFIHAHSPIGGVVSRIIGRKNGIKSIYTAHGFHFYDGAPKKNWLFYYPIEKELSRITDVLITINREDYKRAKERFHAKRTVYIPGVGIDTEKFNRNLADPEKKRKELGVDKKAIFLLSVGELIPRKNHEVVIRALSEMQNPNIRYFIAGKGRGESALRVLVHSLGLDDQIRFLGFRTDISELCQAADLFIFPSHQEGLSMALMEAIACETPVVCSAIRGNMDLIHESAYIFDENSVGDVVRVLRNFTDNSRDDLKRITEGCVARNRLRLKRYDLTVVEKRMRKEYELIGDRKLI